MNEKALKQIHQTIDAAQQGYWMPFVVVCILLGVIFTLVFYIINFHLKQNNLRHESHERIMDKLAESHRENQLLLERVITRQEGQEDRLKHVESKV